MRAYIFALFSLILVACDGLQYDDSSTLSFTSAELSNKVLFSSILLNRDAENGFVVLFNSSSELDEIELGSSATKEALYGEYGWTIVNDKLQVTYPSAITCTSTKQEENTIQLEVTAACEGGTPTNAIIQDTLLSPLSFSTSSLSGRTVTISIDVTEEVIDFNTDGTFLLTKKDENGDVSSSENGVYELSDLTNVVRLNYTDINPPEYSLLMLLEGSISSGVMLDLRHNSDDDTLQTVRIYTIQANDSWLVDDLYDSITLDN
jgi:hypothetical protein